MSQPFLLRCLGRPALIGPDGTVVRIRVKKHLGLLSYLALEPREPHRRDFLTELLWPRAPTSEGRHSLATGISVLRGILGPGAIESGRDVVRLACGWLVTDVGRLERGEVLGDQFNPPIVLGELLQDLDLPDAPSFDHWRDRLRARWRPSIQSALLRLIDSARRSGDWRPMDRLADQLLALEDLNEQGIRAKMEAAAISGDRVGALKVYEDWAAKLHRELSALPSPVMRRFANQLRQGDSLHSPGPLPHSREMPVLPLVGRHREYHALYSAWESTLDRRPRHALVRGDNGVGKSSLVDRVLAAAKLEGAAIARARCYSLEQEIPYAVAAALLRGLLDQPGAAATPPEALADLTQIVPAIKERYACLPSTVPAQGESARLRITEAVYQLIIAVAEEQPVVLAIDDFHLADDASLAVLHLVLRRLEDERVMMVFAGLVGESARSPHATMLLEATDSLNVGLLDIHPLGEEASEAALDILLGDTHPHTSVRRAMIRAARGYPLALTLLAHDWLERRSPASALQLEEMTPELTTCGPQRDYEPLIERVIQRMEPSCRPVLDLAAVLGARMNDLRFYTLLGLSSAQAVGALGILADHGVLRDTGAGLEFVNDVIRTRLYLRLSRAVRRQLHALIADDLLSRGRGMEGINDLELAWHLVRSGRHPEAAAYLLKGARYAIDHGAPWEAERALSTSDGTLGGEDATAGHLLLAEALFEQGREGESRRVALKVDRSGPRWTREVARAMAVAALARVPEQPTEEARECIRTLLDILRDATVARGRGIAARGAALFVLKLGDADIAKELLEVMQTVDERSFSRIDVADLGYARATALYQLRRLDESQREAEDASRKLEAANLVNSTLLGLYCGRGAIECARGRYSEAVRLLEVAHQIARKIGNQTIARACLSNLALCSFRLGEIGDHIRWGELAQRRWPETPETFGDATYTYHLAIGYALCGEGQKAFDALTAGDRSASRLAPAWARQSWLLSRADVLTLLGRQEDAKRAAREAIGPTFQGLLSDSRAGAFARWTARVVSTPEEVVRARAEVSEMLARAEDFDALDNAELLAAAVLLGQLNGDDVSRERQLLEQALGRLPEAVCATLRRFGFLEDAKPLFVARRGPQQKRSGARPTEDPEAPRILDPIPPG